MAQNNSMGFLSESEAKAACEAENWDEQRIYIEKIEEVLMEREGDLDRDAVRQVFQILAAIISKDNLRATQRSLKIIDAICDFPSKASVGDTVGEIFPAVLGCLNNQHKNIREQCVKTLVALSMNSSWSEFAREIGTGKVKLDSDSEKSVLQLVVDNANDFSEDNWGDLVPFIVGCLESKTSSVKSKALEITKNETFVAALNKNTAKLSSAQKKVVLNLLDRRAIRNAEEQGDEDRADDQQPAASGAITLNTSAFSRKLRQREMKVDDGLQLLCDITSWNGFMKKLSLDIRDVFDDDVASLLLSQQSQDRLSGVEALRDIYDSSIGNFEHSADIAIRWCCFQFLGRHLNVSQAALLMLLEEFGAVPKTFSLSKVEMSFAVPIVIWCIATESSAYTGLLHELASHSSDADFASSLLLALNLQHSVVMQTVFDELKTISDLSGVEEDLKKLRQSPFGFVRSESERALLRLTPCSPDNGKKTIGSVEKLQREITRIKNSPESIQDARNILGFIISQFQSMPKVTREIRYLLHCTNSFLSEPLLTTVINISDFKTLLTLICEFSLRCPSEYADALDAIAFSMVTLHADIVLFEGLISFIGQHRERLDRASFASRFFTIGISMIAVSQSCGDLGELRTFAKNVIGQGNVSKDDLRAVLCRSLLAEIVCVQEQQKVESDYFKFNEGFLQPPHQESTFIDEPEPAFAPSGDCLDFFRVIEKLSRRETRADGIRELCQYDDRFPNERIVDTVIRLTPSLRRDIEAYRTAKSGRPSSRSSSRAGTGGGSGSRPSSRSSYRASSGSRPSSRSSQRRPSSRSMQSRP